MRFGMRFLASALVLGYALSMSVPVRTVPRVIQGGMGARISSWELARSVASRGELGITSGTAMDIMLIRELQMGDPEGIWRRAFAAFPDQDMVGRLMDKFFIEGGKPDDVPFKSIPMWTITPPQALVEATVVANFAEIWLAKHNDDSTPTGTGFVGINCLTKIQLPNVPSLYGALLADCDYVISAWPRAPSTRQCRAPIAPDPHSGPLTAVILSFCCAYFRPPFDRSVPRLFPASAVFSLLAVGAGIPMEIVRSARASHPESLLNDLSPMREWARAA